MARRCSGELCRVARLPWEEHLMPLLGFQARFANAVESGEKQQTIRAYRKDKRDPKVGDRLFLYTGLRQKGARKLGEGIVTSAEAVMLAPTFSRANCWTVGGNALTRAERREMAHRDGFTDATEMRAWFEKAHGLPFEGLLIRWRLA